METIEKTMVGEQGAKLVVERTTALDTMEQDTDRLAQLSRRLASEGRNEELLATETATRATLLGHEKLLMSKELEASARHVKELLERTRSDEISLLGLRQENVDLKERVKSLEDAEIEREMEKEKLLAAIGEAQLKLQEMEFQLAQAEMDRSEAIAQNAKLEGERDDAHDLLTRAEATFNELADRRRFLERELEAANARTAASKTSSGSGNQLFEFSRI
eukprot:tig00000655_g2860.t1